MKRDTMLEGLIHLPDVVKPLFEFDGFGVEYENATDWIIEVPLWNTSEEPDLAGLEVWQVFPSKRYKNQVVFFAETGLWPIYDKHGNDLQIQSAELKNIVKASLFIIPFLKQLRQNKQLREVAQGGSLTAHGMKWGDIARTYGVQH